jgi:hypothetical protein
MLGGCFLLQNEFRLYPIKEEQGETLKNWTTQIAAFPIQYKDELESMRRLIKKDYEEYKEVFNKVQTQLMEVITEGNLDLSLYPIPHAMESKVISEEAYQKCAKSLHYGTPLSPIVRYAECEEKCGSSH